MSSDEVKVVRVSRAAGHSHEASEEENSEHREAGRKLLHSILTEMMDQPDHISVTYSVGERTTIYKVDCHPKSLGQLIGSKGKNISGIRAVIAAVMARKGIRAIIEIPYIEPHG